MDTVRVDRWLWAVRVYKTRTAATTACAGGHVKVGGSRVKAAHKVRVGDEVEATVGARTRVLEVVRLIEKRVGAAVAADCLIDYSPPEPERAPEPVVAAREPGAGRPTKRDRRALDRLHRRA